MLVGDFINTIYDAVGTQQDYLNKSVNPLFTNAKICRQLKFALDRYASHTKALEAYYSLPVAGNTASIPLPTYNLRAENIRFIVWMINGYAYPLDIINLNKTWGNFPVAIQGLPRWANIWLDRINVYPQNSNGFNHTTLTANIGTTDTIIPVANTSGFVSKNGRITIDSEIIEYDYKDATNLYGCQRGQEDTTAVSHTSGTTVNENNVWIYYYRKHFDITPDANDVIPDSVLNSEMLVCDEHLEIIADYTSYKLLNKIDPQRASNYKVNFEAWLDKARMQINRGRSRIRKSGEVRDPFLFETPTPIFRV